MFPPSPICPAFVDKGVFPTILPVMSGLLAWFDAESTRDTVVNGAKIPVWYDKSGNSAHAVQTTAGQQPVAVDGVLNGLRVARFSGCSMLFKFQSPREMSIFCVVSPGTQLTSDTEMFFGSSISTPGTSGIGWGLGVGYYSNYGGGWVGPSRNINLLCEVIATNTFKLRTYLKTTTTWNIISNGVAIHTNLADTSIPLGTFYGVLGAEDTTPSRPLSGDIAEFIIFNRVVTNIERLQIEAYLHLKWGV